MDTSPYDTQIPNSMSFSRSEIRENVQPPKESSVLTKFIFVHFSISGTLFSRQCRDKYKIGLFG